MISATTQHMEYSMAPEFALFLLVLFIVVVCLLLGCQLQRSTQLCIRLRKERDSLHIRYRSACEDRAALMREVEHIRSIRPATDLKLLMETTMNDFMHNSNVSERCDAVAGTSSRTRHNQSTRFIKGGLSGRDKTIKTTH